MPSYTESDLAALKFEFRRIQEKRDRLMLSLDSLSIQKPETREFLYQGAMRRLSLVAQTIITIYQAIPPETELPPEKESIDIAVICLHANIINIFGLLDCLAHVWVSELDCRGKGGQRLRRIDIGLDKESTRPCLSQEFRDLLDGRKEWFRYLKGYRDSLAHRVPPYIPPHLLDPRNAAEYQEVEGRLTIARDNNERERLERRLRDLSHFKAIMLFDVGELREVFFHAQLVADFLTVEEIIDTFRVELEKRLSGVA